MTGSQRHGVVEEEDRCPSAGTGEGRPPSPELGQAGDPEGTSVVAHNRASVVDQATTIAGEHAATGDGMQVTPWIDPVAAWHRILLCQGCPAPRHPIAVSRTAWASLS